MPQGGSHAESTSDCWLADSSSSLWRIRAYGYPDSNPGSTLGVSSYAYRARAYSNSESYEYSNTIRYGCTRADGDSNTDGNTDPGSADSDGYTNA